MRTLPYVILFAVITTLTVPLLVHAAPSYTVSPLVVDETLEKRDVREHILTIVNTGDSPVTIYPTVNNISLKDGGTIEAFLPPVMSDQTSSLASWLEIARGGLDVFRGASATIPLVIRVNPNATPGEYHAFVGFPYGGNRDEAERMLLRGDAPGVIVTVRIEDKRLSLLKLAAFTVERFVTNSHSGVSHFTIRNPGDEVLIPQGDIIIYDKTGKEVSSVQVNTDRSEIQPGEERTFLTPIPVEGLFGKYKAYLSVDYGTANLASIQDTSFFYVFPLVVMLAIIGVIVVIVTLVSLFLHRRMYEVGADDGSDALSFHVREGTSDPAHHDIDLRSS